MYILSFKKKKWWLRERGNESKGQSCKPQKIILLFLKYIGVWLEIVTGDSSFSVIFFL